ncbi:MAG: hypothetical protein HOE90_17420 [Bacteriovoracaceae bacterium]|nr:hypothetical protein [Bacteriovoracaceae bacterium]
MVSTKIKFILFLTAVTFAVNCLAEDDELELQKLSPGQCSNMVDSLKEVERKLTELSIKDGSQEFTYAELSTNYQSSFVEEELARDFYLKVKREAHPSMQISFDEVAEGKKKWVYKQKLLDLISKPLFSYREDDGAGVGDEKISLLDLAKELKPADQITGTITDYLKLLEIKKGGRNFTSTDIDSPLRRALSSESNIAVFSNYFDDPEVLQDLIDTNFGEDATSTVAGAPGMTWLNQFNKLWHEQARSSETFVFDDDEVGEPVFGAKYKLAHSVERREDYKKLALDILGSRPAKEMHEMIELMVHYGKDDCSSTYSSIFSKSRKYKSMCSYFEGAPWRDNKEELGGLTETMKGIVDEWYKPGYQKLAYKYCHDGADTPEPLEDVCEVYGSLIEKRKKLGSVIDEGSKDARRASRESSRESAEESAGGVSSTVAYTVLNEVGKELPKIIYTGTSAYSLNQQADWTVTGYENMSNCLLNYPRTWCYGYPSMPFANNFGFPIQQAYPQTYWNEGGLGFLQERNRWNPTMYSTMTSGFDV